MLLNSYMLYCSRQQHQLFNNTNESLFSESHLALKIIMTISILFCVASFISGLVLDSFTLDFLGLGGFILQQVGVDSIHPYSFVTIGLQLRQGFVDSESLSAYTTQIIYMLLVIVFPAFQVVLQLYMWFAPINKRMHLLFEYVCVWSSLDMMILAIFASVVR